MRKLALPLAALLLLSGRALAGVPAQQQEQDPKAKAESWIAQADSVKVLVDGVIASAVEAGAEEHAVAKDQLTDAQRWSAEGVKALHEAKQAYEAGDYTKAGNMGNMSWQYYVKAGTAAVLAAKIASGGT